MLIAVDDLDKANLVASHSEQKCFTNQKHLTAISTIMYVENNTTTTARIEIYLGSMG